jgi:septum formation inhibitor-activating ATPase MinD
MKTVEEWLQREIETPIEISIDENVYGQIITGIGVGREGNGCSTSLYYQASRLAQLMPHKNICIVDLHLTEPCLDKFFNIKSDKLIMNMDSLFKQITDTLTKNMIQNNTINSKKQPNLFLLPGTRKPFSADSFSADVLLTILMALKQLYHVVFVDVSAHFDNPGTVAGLIAADTILAYSNGDQDGLRLFNLYQSTLLDHHPDLVEKIKGIVVENLGARKGELGSYLRIPLIGALPHMTELLQPFSDKSEVKGKQQAKYLAEIDEILSQMDLYQGQAEKQTKAKRKGGKLWPIRRSSSSNV